MTLTGLPHSSELLPPDSLSPPKLQPAKTFEDLLKSPMIAGLEEAIAEFPSDVQKGVQKGVQDIVQKGIQEVQMSARDREIAEQKARIKEALERAKKNRDPLAKVAKDLPPVKGDGGGDTVGLEAPSAAKKVPPKKDDSHADLNPPLDIIAPTLGRENRDLAMFNLEIFLNFFNEKNGFINCIFR